MSYRERIARLWNLACVVASLSWVRLRTRIARTIGTGYVIVDDRHYDVAYYHGSYRYTIRFPKSRGPSRITKITTVYDVDVTSIVKTFMGPCHNFHGIPTTPKMLGYASLTIELYGGTKKAFGADDIITI